MPAVLPQLLILEITVLFHYLTDDFRLDYLLTVISHLLHNGACTGNGVVLIQILVTSVSDL